MTPVRLEPAASRSWVKLSTTEPLRSLPGRVVQSVMCLATDACLTAIPGVASSISARSHTFVEIDHEIISTVILLPSADSFKKGCCQLQAKVCARITGYPLVQACPGKKSVVRWTDRPAMTIAVDLGRKATKQTNTLRSLIKSLVNPVQTNGISIELHTVKSRWSIIYILWSKAMIFFFFWRSVLS